MPSKTPTRRQQVGQYVALVGVYAYAAVQFYGADPRPWRLAAAWAVATAVVLGPSAWVARDRLPPDRLETLTYVVFCAAILAIPVGLGAALAFEVPFFPYGPGFLAGVALGTLVVFLVERTGLPERYRARSV